MHPCAPLRMSGDGGAWIRKRVDRFDPTRTPSSPRSTRSGRPAPWTAPPSTRPSPSSNYTRPAAWTTPPSRPAACPSPPASLPPPPSRRLRATTAPALAGGLEGGVQDAGLASSVRPVRPGRRPRRRAEATASRLWPLLPSDRACSRGTGRPPTDRPLVSRPKGLRAPGTDRRGRPWPHHRLGLARRPRVPSHRRTGPRRETSAGLRESNRARGAPPPRSRSADRWQQAYRSQDHAGGGWRSAASPHRVWARGRPSRRPARRGSNPPAGSLPRSWAPDRGPVARQPPARIDTPERRARSPGGGPPGPAYRDASRARSAGSTASTAGASGWARKYCSRAWGQAPSMMRSA